MSLETVAIEKLHESKRNPRQFFGKEGMSDLVESITHRGVITPLIARKNEEGFEILAGARRYRAAKTAGLKEVPVMVVNLDDTAAFELMIHENDQRADVHPLEQSASYLQLQTDGQLTVEQVAKRVSKPIPFVAKRMKYGNLIEPVRKLFAANKISIGHADQVARLQPEQQKESLGLLKEGTSVAHLKAEIERSFFLVLKDAPFDPTDATLVPEQGSCMDCPKRTGFNKALFEDVKGDDICTDPEGYERKVRAFIKRQVGTHPDAILLAIASQYQAKETKHEIHWVKAGAKNCPDTKEGVVVEVLEKWPEENRKAKLGDAIKVCVNPKCKTHHPPQPKSDYDTQTGRSKSAEKLRKIELRRRGLVFKAVASKPFATTEKDARSILDWAIRGMSGDVARAICKAMEWEIIEGKNIGKDYHGTVAKNLKTLTTDGVEQWLYLVMLADTDLWFYSGADKPTWANLEAKAKLAKVPLDELAKQAKEKPAKLEKAKPKSKKK